MTEEILERAKAADIDVMAITDWGQLRDLFGGLIAEVEAKNDKIAQDAITIQMHHGNVLTLQKEVERLRSEIKIDNKLLADRDRIYQVCQCPEHGSCTPYVIEQLKSIPSKDTRIKELEAWLVEERANLILEQIRGGSIITLQDPDERRANAIRQLQAEGKIGGVKPEYGGQHHCGTQIIRTGGGEWHCPKCNPLLTAEQRKALEYAIEALHHTHCPECETLLMRADPEPAISAIRDLLSGSVPAWKVTYERKAAISNCIELLYGKAHVFQDKADRDTKFEVLRGMLKEKESLQEVKGLGK